MKKIQDIAVSLFIASVAVLSGVSLLGIWDIFGHDVITKSFETVGVLAFVAIVVLAASAFIEKKSDHQAADMPSPIFKNIRRTTIGIFIAAVSLLALIGVLSIWDVISDHSVLHKALISVCLLAFSAFIIIISCLQREDNEMLQKRISPGAIVLAIVAFFFIYVWFGQYIF